MLPVDALSFALKRDILQAYPPYVMEQALDPAQKPFALKGTAPATRSESLSSRPGWKKTLIPHRGM